VIAGDIGYIGTMAYRLIDSALLPGLVHDNWDVALQMSMIDIEAYAVVAAVLWGSQLAVGRTRPFVESCEEGTLDPEKIDKCDTVDSGNARRSFIAGHSAVAVTGAALTCLHHDRMPLYGSRAGDMAACGTHVAFATITTMSRALSENHYFTDTLLGISLGLVAGWIVPSALHYGFFDDDDDDTALDRRPSAPRGSQLELAVAPTANDDGPGVMLIGRW